MILEENLRKIGRLLKPHGINGEVVMLLGDDLIDNDVDVASLPCILLRIDGIFVPFFISSVRQKSSETDLLTIDGISNEVEAASLCPNDVYAEISALPESEHSSDEGFYAEDLVGFDAFVEASGNSEKIGKITGVEDSTENYLFIIERADGKGNLLVPVAAEFIVGVDADGRTVTFDVPEGLMEL